MYLSSSLFFSCFFLLVRSCFLVTLIKCLKGQKSQISLFESALQMYLSLSLSLSLSFCFCVLFHTLTIRGGGGVNPYGQPDRKKTVFLFCIFHILHNFEEIMFRNSRS